MSIAATPESIELFKILTETKEIMNTKHEIEIPGLPEGYRTVEAMIDPDDTGYLGDNGNLYIQAKIKLEKIKPRRIVLEETDCENAKIAFFDDAGMWTYCKIKVE